MAPAYSLALCQIRGVVQLVQGIVRGGSGPVEVRGRLG